MNAATRFPEFRFYFFTTKYDETVAFYRDVLQLQVDRSWNRSDQHRGTVFTSPNGTGLIEVEQGGKLPQIDGGFYIEVDDIQGWYDRVTAAGAMIKKSLGVTDYGHLNFKVVDPNGVEVGFFQCVS
ncbi:MAG: VOC family protein [Rhodanobacter sp.]|nr:MAG: VOC family protein [Rhodanobacter sp.]